MSKQLIAHDPALVPRPEGGAGFQLALGLDLGTTTGVAYTYFKPGEPYAPTHPFYLGQWDLSPGEHGTNPIRFVRLRHFLEAVRPDVVFFEEVRNTPAGGTITKFNLSAIVARAATSAQLFGALMATVTSWCEEREIPCDGVPIGTIKKRATGKGNASKEDVIRACNALFHTDFVPEGYDASGVDNISDAAFCLLCGLETYADGVAERIHPGASPGRPSPAGKGRGTDGP